LREAAIDESVEAFDHDEAATPNQERVERPICDPSVKPRLANAAQHPSRDAGPHD
jgi:hypothetical protein